MAGGGGRVPCVIDGLVHVCVRVCAACEAVIEIVIESAGARRSRLVGFVANHPDSSWDIGCATWDVFNFFTDGDALACTSFKLPDMTQTSKIAAVTPKTKYDPICMSECNICLEYPVPGYGDTYCLWDDYKGNWPSDLYCLQACPSGTTRQLLGSATTDTECYSLCTCGNGLVSC